jgi:hypothetical protein
MGRRDHRLGDRGIEAKVVWTIEGLTDSDRKRWTFHCRAMAVLMRSGPVTFNELSELSGRPDNRLRDLRKNGWVIKYDRARALYELISEGEWPELV